MADKTKKTKGTFATVRGTPGKGGLGAPSRTPVSLSGKLNLRTSGFDWSTVLVSLFGSLIVAFTAFYAQHRANESNRAIERLKLSQANISHFGTEFPARDQAIVNCLEAVDRSSWELGSFIDLKHGSTGNEGKLGTLTIQFKDSITNCRIVLASALLLFESTGVREIAFRNGVDLIGGSLDSLSSTLLGRAQRRHIAKDPSEPYVLLALEEEIFQLKKVASASLRTFREIAVTTVREFSEALK